MTCLPWQELQHSHASKHIEGTLGRLRKSSAVHGLDRKLHHGHGLPHGLGAAGGGGEPPPLGGSNAESLHASFRRQSQTDEAMKERRGGFDSASIGEALLITLQEQVRAAPEASCPATRAASRAHALPLPLLLQAPHVLPSSAPAPALRTELN